MGDKPMNANPLLPDRFIQGDMFICDIFDAAPKADIAGMEYPTFTVAKKPDMVSRHYDNGDKWIEIRPSSIGLATVFDRDILIFCISQLIAALNEGREISKTVSFKVADYLKATGKPLGGSAYARAEDALRRLKGTEIETNVETGGERIWEAFGIIEAARTVRRSSDGALLDVQVTLSDWVFKSINAKEVLTLHRDYFRLKRPLERRIYELCRKHCGHSPEFKIGLKKLKEKCGSRSTDKEFRRAVKTIVTTDMEHNHFPDYKLQFADDFLTCFNRGTMPAIREDKFEGALANDIYSEARTIAPGWDVRVIEHEWRVWCGREEIIPKNPNKHYLRFCKTWFERRGRPT